MRRIYRLKHVPTGLYWVKRSYGKLSENGTLFSTGCNSFSGMSPGRAISLRITNDKFIKKHIDIFRHVGELREHPELKWDEKIHKRIPTGKTCFTWYMGSKVSDFVKEFVVVKPKVSESSTDSNRELIEKIASIYWNHRTDPDIENYEEWLNLIQDELRQQ